MENIQGIKVAQFPLELNHVIDLIYFEGPLLSLFNNKSCDYYLYYWCDVDDIYNRWIIFRITQQNIKNYLLKKTTLFDLVVKPVDGFVYVINIDNELRFSNVKMIKPDKLPQSYIPKSDSFYDMESEFDELNKKEKLLLLSFLINEKDIIKYLSINSLKFQYFLNAIEKQLKSENFSPAYKFQILASQFGVHGIAANDIMPKITHLFDSDLPLSTFNYSVNYDHNDILFSHLSY